MPKQVSFLDWWCILSTFRPWGEQPEKSIPAGPDRDDSMPNNQTTFLLSSDEEFYSSDWAGESLPGCRALTIGSWTRWLGAEMPHLLPGLTRVPGQWQRWRSWSKLAVKRKQHMHYNLSKIQCLRSRAMTKHGLLSQKQRLEVVILGQGAKYVGEHLSQEVIL